MCIIQGYYFTKSGVAEFGYCNLNLTDVIGIEAVVTFSGSEIGKQYHINYGVKIPNGLIYFTNSIDKIVYGTETYNTQLPTSTIPLVTGVYTMVNVEVREQGTNTLVCYG